MSAHSMYARPRKLADATALLGQLEAGAMVFAGGQELMPHLNYGRIEPAVIVDIGQLKELTGVRLGDDSRLAIGALTVHRDIQRDPLIAEHAPLLANAAAQIGGGWQVHNRGTIGGNIVSMHPLYDIVPSLRVLGAAVELTTTDGVREMPLAELMSRTDHGLGVSSLLTRVLVPRLTPEVGWAYYKLKIVEGSYGSANAAVTVTLDASRRITSLQLAVGAVSEQLLVPEEVCRRFTGRRLDDDLLDAFADACAASVREPVADQRGDAQYRRAMAGVAARRALVEAAGRIRTAANPVD